MSRDNRPTVNELLPLVNLYYALPGNGSGGSLHIVLEDHNVEDHSVRHCLAWAQERGDVVGEALARLLLRMTRTQRARVSGQKTRASPFQELRLVDSR
jgi:hypothetical protein